MGLTIADVARTAGVSTATVSRYLNQPDMVSPDRQKRIASAIKKLNYVPNHMAKALTTSHNMTVGILVPDINNAHYPPIVRGIEDGLSQSSYISFLCNTDQDTEREKHYISALRSQQVAGMIFVGSRPADPARSSHLISLRESLPILLVNDDLLSGKVASIGHREEDEIWQAVSYLQSLGHNEIGFINSSAPLTTYFHKEQGFLQAMEQKKLPVRSQWIIHEKLGYEQDGYQAMKKLLELKEQPSAIIAATDQMAAGAISALLEQGYQVPEDYSIIGYSNSCIAPAAYPGITTIDQNGYQLGVQAAKRMLNIIRGAKDDHQATYVGTHLVIRKSTGLRVSGK